MSDITRLQIVAKMNRIAELGEALADEFQDGKPFGLEDDFAVATTNLKTALLWAIAGLSATLKGTPE